MINCIFRGENYGSKIKDIDPVFPEFLCGNSLDLDQLFECDINAKFPCNLGIGRFFKIGGMWLRNKDIPDLQFELCLVRQSVKSKALAEKGQAFQDYQHRQDFEGAKIHK